MWSVELGLAERSPICHDAAMRSHPLLLVLVATASLAACSAGSPGPADAPEPALELVGFDDGWGQIFVMGVDGSGLRQVSPPVAEGMSDGNYSLDAALSPDGTRLAYTRGRSIDVVNLDTDEVTTVFEGGYQPVFSPDGSTLAVTDGSSISVMNADGSDVRVIARDEFASQAAFSVDGSTVVYNASGYLVEVPVAGGEPTVVLRDQFWNADPAFSPDGSTLVFSSNRGGNNGSEIYSMPVGGGDITALTDTYSVHPEFSSDGSRIFYTRATTETGEPVRDVTGPTRSQLASMNADGSDEKRVTPPSLTAQNPSTGG